MHADPRPPITELRRLVRMLEKTARLAEHASLVGALSGGTGYAIRSYNAVLDHLAAQGQLSPTLFAPLPESASLAEVGFASAQLAGYLSEGLPDARSERRKGGMFGNGNVIIGSLDWSERKNLNT
jgi:hypothetical protein